MTAFFVLIRFLGEMALWLGAGGLVLSVFTRLSDLTPALLIFAGSAALAWALGQKRQVLRYLGLLPLLALGFLGKSVGDWLLLAPGAAYVIWSIWKNALPPDRNAIYYRFTSLILVPLIFGCLCIPLNRGWCFFCCMLSMTMTIFLCRTLRHTETGGKKLILLESGLLGVMCLTGYIIGRDFMLRAELEVLKVLKDVVFAVLYPVLMVLLYMIEAVVWLLSMLFPFSPEGISVPSMGEVFQDLPENILPEHVEPNRWGRIILIALGVAAFLAAAYYLMRYLRSGAGTGASAEKGGIPDAVSTILEKRERRSVSFLDRSPEAGVRRAYLAYCRYLLAHGQEFSPQDTTRSVNEQAGLDDNPAAQELRSLYLRARYTGSGGLTREDARRASALAKQLTKKK